MAAFFTSGIADLYNKALVVAGSTQFVLQLYY